MIFKVTNASGYVENNLTISGTTSDEEWATVRDAASGQSVGTSIGYTTTTSHVQCKYTLVILGDDNVKILRYFLYFDTSSIGDTPISSARLWIYGQSAADAELSVQQGTQADILSVDDYDAFSGTEFGHTSGYAVNKWNEIVFNATGRDAINTSGITKLCLREYDHDYLDVNIGNDYYYVGTILNAAFSHQIKLEINADSEFDTKDTGVIKINTATGVEGITPIKLITDNSEYPLRICGSDGEVYGILNNNLLASNEYNGENDYLPDNVNLDYPWDDIVDVSATVAVEDDANCVNGKRLNISTDTAAADLAYYSQTLSSSDPIRDIRNEIGYYVEWSAKVITSGTEYSQIIQVRDGVYVWQIYMSDTAIGISSTFIVESTQTYNMDTTNSYHTYQVYVKGTSFTLKVDGTTRITATLDYDNTDNYIFFGDGYDAYNIGGQVYWDYIRYYNRVYPSKIKSSSILDIVLD